MKIDPHSHVIEGVAVIASPNCDERPDDADIDLIVVHAISLPPGDFGGPWVEALFTNCLDPEADPYFEEICELRVSAHAVIWRSGAVTQFVPFHQRAWHAGESVFEGRQRCNDFSIGIELEGCDDAPFEDAQYTVLAELAGALMARYPRITPERIIGHSDVAPGRKTDPGPRFDWTRLRALLNVEFSGRAQA